MRPTQPLSSDRTLFVVLIAAALVLAFAGFAPTYYLKHWFGTPPLEFWVQAVHHKLRVVELPVPLIYLDEKRSFGGALDDGGKRLEYYHRVLDSAIAATERDAGTAEDKNEGAVFPRETGSATWTPPKTGCQCS